MVMGERVEGEWQMADGKWKMKKVFTLRGARGWHGFPALGGQGENGKWKMALRCGVRADGAGILLWVARGNGIQRGVTPEVERGQFGREGGEMADGKWKMEKSFTLRCARGWRWLPG